MLRHQRLTHETLLEFDLRGAVQRQEAEVPELGNRLSTPGYSGKRFRLQIQLVKILVSETNSTKKKSFSGIALFSVVNVKSSISSSSAEVPRQF